MFLTGWRPRKRKPACLVLDLVEGVAGNDDAAGLGERLEPRGDVDAVAVDVVALDDHVAEIDADPELDALVLGRIGVALGHAALDRERALYGVDHARELDQGAIAHQLDDAAVAGGDLGLDQLLAEPSGGRVPASSSAIRRL